MKQFKKSDEFIRYLSKAQISIIANLIAEGVKIEGKTFKYSISKMTYNNLFLFLEHGNNDFYKIKWSLYLNRAIQVVHAIDGNSSVFNIENH